MQLTTDLKLDLFARVIQALGIALEMKQTALLEQVLLREDMMVKAIANALVCRFAVLLRYPALHYLIKMRKFVQDNDHRRLKTRPKSRKVVPAATDLGKSLEDDVAGGGGSDNDEEDDEDGALGSDSDDEQPDSDDEQTADWDEDELRSRFATAFEHETFHQVNGAPNEKYLYVYPRMAANVPNMHLDLGINHCLPQTVDFSHDPAPQTQ